MSQARGENRFPLGNGVEAFKGVFASVRPVLNAARNPGLSVNVDVANGTFLSQMDLIQSAAQVCRARNADDLANMFASAKRDWHKSIMYKFMKAYTHVGVKITHRKEGQVEFKVQRFLNKGLSTST